MSKLSRGEIETVVRQYLKTHPQYAGYPLRGVIADAAYERGEQDERKRILGLLDEPGDTRDLDRRVQELKNEDA